MFGKVTSFWLIILAYYPEIDLWFDFVRASNSPNRNISEKPNVGDETEQPNATSCGPNNVEVFGN